MRQVRVLPFVFAVVVVGILLSLGLAMLLSGSPTVCPPFAGERPAMIRVVGPTEEDVEWLEKCGFEVVP